jgi:hypothetical protein
MNRILHLLDRSDDAPSYGDFVVVAGTFGSVCVTHEVARYIECRLDRRWVPTWIVFHDRVGSRFRVRSHDIRLLAESTCAQRAADRRLDRARRAEDDDQRAWDGDA